MDVYSLVRLKTTHKLTELAQEDFEIFSKAGYEGVEIKVPLVRLLAKTLLNGPEYYYKPLLFSYGFVKVPIYLTYNYEALQFLSLISRTIGHFVMRSKDSLKQERLAMAADESQPNPNFKVNQCLVETIDDLELSRLEAMAKNISVYPATDELSIGAHIILRGYPFSGLSAKILEKQGNHFKVLLTSSLVEVSITKENIFYSPYEDEKSKEICFSDLGYVPDISTES